MVMFFILGFYPGLAFHGLLFLRFFMSSGLLFIPIARSLSSFCPPCSSLDLSVTGPRFAVEAGLVTIKNAGDSALSPACL